MRTLPYAIPLRRQAKKIIASVPKLPEAPDRRGIVGMHQGEVFDVIFLGESTMAGVGASSHEAGFAGAFSTALSESLHQKVRWSVYARSGYTLKKTNQKLLPLITEKTCHLVVIGIGANDAFAMISPMEWEQQLKQFVFEIGKRFEKTPILFANMPPLHEFPAFTPLMRKIGHNRIMLMSKQLRRFIDKFPHVFFNDQQISMREFLQAGEVAGYADGIHPNEAAYQAWARHMVDFLLEQNIKFSTQHQAHCQQDVDERFDLT